MELEIRNIEFYVEETDITDRPKDEKETDTADHCKDEEESPSRKRKFHEIDATTYNYEGNYRDEKGVLMKRISFDFKNNPKENPQHGYFDRSYLPIRLIKGEKLDFHITPKGFPAYKDYEVVRDSKENINSHICNIRLFPDQ
ncbi:MAG: hypothetical protein AB3N16_12650 [Flavobacteriaceae bacterium]